MRNSFKQSLVFGVMFGCVASAPGMAQAQSMNYGALQSLFGEPITTSATGTPQRAGDVAADMTIITADQIRQAGTRNIPEIIGIYTPGITVMEENDNSFDIGVRGYNRPYNPRLLVLIDGRQVFSDDYSRTPWDNLPVNLDDIRQIEVVKGASSALFGSNATGGVVNIITYSPLYDNDRTVSLNGGTQTSFMADGTYTQKFAGTQGGLKVSAGRSQEDNFPLIYATNGGADSNADAPGPHHGYVNANGVYKVTPDFIINNEVSYSEKQGVEVVPSFTVQPVKTVSYSGRTGFDWKTPYGLIKSDNYVNVNTLGYLFYPDTPGAVSETFSQNSLVVSHLEDQFSVGTDNTFRAMVEYRHKFATAHSAGDYIYEKPTTNEDTFTAGGTWLWQISSKLSWTNAVRVDANQFAVTGLIDPGSAMPNGSFSQAYTTLSGNSGLVYRPTDLDTFRLTYGRANENPSIIDTGFYQSQSESGGVALVEEGNGLLKPTVVDNYELGYDRKVPDIFSTVRMSAYYEVNKDIIAYPATLPFGFDGTDFTVTALPANMGNSDGFGGELGISGQHPSGFRWDASYSLDNVRESKESASALGYQNSAPENDVRLSLGYTLGRWEADVHNQFLSSAEMLRRLDPTSQSLTPVHINGYYTLGARLGYKISDNFTASLYGTNLTANTTVENPYAPVERRVLAGISGKF